MRESHLKKKLSRRNANEVFARSDWSMIFILTRAHDSMAVDSSSQNLKKTAFLMPPLMLLREGWPPVTTSTTQKSADRDNFRLLIVPCAHLLTHVHSTHSLALFPARLGFASSRVQRVYFLLLPPSSFFCGRDMFTRATVGATLVLLVLNVIGACSSPRAWPPSSREPRSGPSRLILSK